MLGSPGTTARRNLNDVSRLGYAKKHRRVAREARKANVSLLLMLRVYCCTNGGGVAALPEGNTGSERMFVCS